MRPKNDIIGKTFGNLKVIKDDGARAVTGDVLWLLNCSCGEECRATSSDLKRGRRGFCLKCKDAISTKSPLKTLYGSYRRGAIARGLSFNISIEQMHDIIVKNCHYCGTPPRHGHPGTKDAWGSPGWNGSSGATLAPRRGGV
jgi:hypothetical protein